MSGRSCCSRGLKPLLSSRLFTTDSFFDWRQCTDERGGTAVTVRKWNVQGRTPGNKERTISLFSTERRYCERMWSPVEIVVLRPCRDSKIRRPYRNHVPRVKRPETVVRKKLEPTNVFARMYVHYAALLYGYGSSKELWCWLQDLTLRHFWLCIDLSTTIDLERCTLKSKPLAMWDPIHVQVGYF